MRRWMHAAGVTTLVSGVMIAVPMTASAATFGVSSTADDPADSTTLRGAIAAAEASPGADTITLQGGTTYALTNGEGDLDITTDITIEGNGATIDASGLGDRAFHVLAGGDLTISGVTVTGGEPADAPSAAGGGSGGAFLNAGTLSISDSTLDGNSAARAGGAIEASAGSTTTLLDTDLTDNAAGPTPGNGGGLHLTGAGTVSITGGTVSGNTAAAGTLRHCKYAACARAIFALTCSASSERKLANGLPLIGDMLVISWPW